MATEIAETELKKSKSRTSLPSIMSANSTLLEKIAIICERIGENIFFVILMTFVTLWALFSDDIRQSITTKDSDLGFEVVISICFFLFVIEIIMGSFYKKDYLWFPDWKPLPRESILGTWFRRAQFGSFFFWLDVLATISTLLEIDWIMGNSLSGGGKQASNAGNASRAGRAARLIRVVRMVRLIRMVKLYKYASSTLSTFYFWKKPDATPVPVDDDEEDLPPESHVGAAMSDLTTRRVIVLVLTMLIVIPLLTVQESDLTPNTAFNLVHRMALRNHTDPYTYSAALASLLQSTIDHTRVIKISLGDINNVYYQEPSLLNSLRQSEMIEFDFQDTSPFKYRTYMAFDTRRSSQAQARYSMYTTLLIMFLLVSGTYFFSNDVNYLVIGPIERMVALVQKISKNPLGVEYKMLGEKEGFLEGMETTILLTTITKIGGLMRVGFGEAGASIIARNLADSSGGKLNLMGSGSKIQSIFGFCDVRQFTDTTECLQEEVMLFVNRIAHILHGIVVQCSGSANKNIGDAFLLTWKINENLSMDSEEVSKLADQAMLSFCKSFIELSRYQDFICNFSPAANTRLYKRFPEYSVRIGAGLHVGWAIEGAIGSNRKIDASYLSPNVNFTEFLESSTKAYGVSMLFSEQFVRLLSPHARKYVRQVDRVSKSEDSDPIGLYTYDADMSINWQEFAKLKRLGKTGPAHRPPRRASVGGRKPLPPPGAPPGVGGGSESPSTPSIADNRATIQPTRFNKQTSTLLTSQTIPTPGRRGSAMVPNAGNNPRIPPHFKGTDPEAGIALSTVAPVPEEVLEVDPDKIDPNVSPNITVPAYSYDIWDKDEDLVELRRQVDTPFRQLWATGIEHYISGDWKRAQEVFSQTLRMNGHKDGPSSFLLETMKEYGGMAPSDWKGYRCEGGGH